MEWIKKRIMAQIPIQSKDFVRKELDRLTEEILKKMFKSSFIEHLTEEQQKELKECFTQT